MNVKKNGFRRIPAVLLAAAAVLTLFSCDGNGSPVVTDGQEQVQQQNSNTSVSSDGGDLPASIPEMKNLYRESEIEKSKWFRFGKLAEDSKFGITDYLCVTPGKSLHAICSNEWLSAWTVFAFFDKAKNFHSEISANMTDSAQWPDGHFDYAVTVPPGAAYVRVNVHKRDFSSEVIALGEVDLMSYYEMIGKPAPAYDRESPLYGKSVIFIGDSITYARAHESGAESGWASRIGKDCGMIWKNAGVSGTAIAECGRGTIVTQLAEATEKTDYVIAGGMTNDAIGEVAIGTVSPEGTAQFDLTTYCGSLEHLFATVKVRCPHAKIGFILPYRQPNGQYSERQHDMSDYVTATLAVCEKWKVPVLNFYDNSEINAILQGDAAKYMDDGTHVNSAGYDVLTPYVKAFMESL